MERAQEERERNRQAAKQRAWQPLTLSPTRVAVVLVAAGLSLVVVLRLLCLEIRDSNSLIHCHAHRATVLLISKRVESTRAAWCAEKA